MKLPQKNAFLGIVYGLRMLFWNSAWFGGVEYSFHSCLMHIVDEILKQLQLAILHSVLVRIDGVL